MARQPDLAQYAREDVLHAEVALGTLTYRGYHGPALAEGGGYEKKWVRWTLVVTRRRLVVRHRRGPVVDVPWTDPRAGLLHCAVEGRKLLVRIDAARFRPDARGTVEVRVRCADASAVLRLVDVLRAHGRR